MEKTQEKFDTQEILANYTANLNMEVELLLEKFVEFQKIANAMDVTLFNNFRCLVDILANFLDRNPRLIGLLDAKERVSFKEEHLERVIVIRCDVCEDVIGTEFEDVQQHIQTPEHQSNLAIGNDAAKVKRKKKNKKQPIGLQYLPKQLKKMIAVESLDWVKEAVQEANALKNIPEYSALEDSVVKLVKKEYPKAKAYVFGSRTSGMGSKNSDIDVFVDVDNTFNSYSESRDDKIEKLRKVRALMEKENLEWKNLLAIERARVPVLKVFNTTLRLDIDISFSNGLGKCNSRLIEYFFTLQPLCNKMCIYLKKWRNLAEFKRAITPYTFVLMVIFYLQLEKLLPSVQMLQSGIIPYEIGPWIANFAEKSLDELKLPYVEDTDQVVMTYLKKFFDFYSRLPNKKRIISPYLGCAVYENDLHEYSEYERYFNYCKEKPDYALKTDGPFCVQDPIEHNHNVAKALSKRGLALMQRYFKISAEILETKLKKGNLRRI